MFVKNIFKSVIYLHKLKRLQDCKIESCIKHRLVQKWERTRHEQAQRILTKEEQIFKESCNNYEVKIDRERIAIIEIGSKFKYTYLSKI